MQLPLAAYSANKTRQLDKLAIVDHNIPGFSLMKRAAQAAFDVFSTHFERAQSIAVFCGPGNNGGDAYVFASLCLQQGLDVIVYAVGGVPKTNEARRACKEWEDQGGAIHPFTDNVITQDVIVDGLLGLGIKGEVAKEYATVIEAINESTKPVLSIDIPSGLDATTGCVQGIAVNATLTITFIGLKTGLIQNDGFSHCGKLCFDNLGVPAQIYEEVEPTLSCLFYENLITKFPMRRLNAHKGSSGHVCVIGGGEIAYSGAVCLASEAALRSGCGLASCVIPERSLPLMSRLAQEVMCHPVKEPQDIDSLLQKAQVVVFGPGLGQNQWSQRFFKQLRNMAHVKVVDADGLNLLAQKPCKMPNCILTPHPREAARLLNVDTQTIQADRIQAARTLYEKFGGVIVLKGAGTLVISDQGLFIQPLAIPALATAGTGDVLSGIIGGLLAQGLSMHDAACIGVSIHATAGSIEQSMGAQGMLASDLFLHIRSLLNPTLQEHNIDNELFSSE